MLMNKKPITFAILGKTITRVGRKNEMSTTFLWVTYCRMKFQEVSLSLNLNISSYVTL